MTDFGYPTWIDELLDDLARHLATSGLYSPDAIFTYLGNIDDMLSQPPRDAFCVLAPTSFDAHQPTVEGGGNDTPRLDGRITITQFARLQLDRDRQDSRLVQDRQRGLAQSARKLFKFLQMWEPVDSQERSILIEPGRMIGLSFNTRKTPGGWAAVQTTWETKFLADLS
jgi:hypothetical protein